MPSFTMNVGDIIQNGPIAEIVVTPTAQFVAALVKAGQTPPAPIKAMAMIDTGAQLTVLNPGIVSGLNLPPVGQIQMSTPSTTTPVPTTLHAVDITFFVNGIPTATVQNIAAAMGTLSGQHIQCLIGRDVLRNAVLVYTGYINQFTLSF